MGPAVMPATVVHAVLAQMLQALLLLRHSIILHGDVKPGNICLMHDGPVGIAPRVILVDFGSGAIGGDKCNPYQQSCCYRAPEVMLGLQWTCKIDLWSLGCTLMECPGNAF